MLIGLKWSNDYFELLNCSGFILMKQEKAKLFNDIITSGLFFSNAPFPFSHRRHLRTPLQAQKTSSLPSWEIIIFYFRVFLFYCCNVCVAVVLNIPLKKNLQKHYRPPLDWSTVFLSWRDVDADYPALKALLHIHQHSVFWRNVVTEL